MTTAQRLNGAHMHKDVPHFNFLATGVGSVPFLNIKDTCHTILEHFPSMPFWPQFAKRSFLEDMSAQYCEGLPLLDINEKERTLTISPLRNKESELTMFYEHFLSQDMDYFSISRDYAPGFYAILDFISQNPGHTSPYIKGQTVGPVTFVAGILDHEGKPVLHNTELSEAMINGLAIKALWQVQKLSQYGKQTILFLDEPCLSGFGSAFSSFQRYEVIDILRKVIDYLRGNSDTLIGIHCCGNTDWPMIIETGVDIINFDAFEYMDHFLLYPDDIKKFINNGGTVAWGIVPTSGFTGKESIEGLSSIINKGFDRIQEWGIDRKVLAQRSILTPACGMGTMDPETAKKGLILLSELSQMCKEMPLT